MRKEAGYAKREFDSLPLQGQIKYNRARDNGCTHAEAFWYADRAYGSQRAELTQS